MTNNKLTDAEKAALLGAAERATKGEWCAFIDVASKTYAIHTPHNKAGDNVINWTGFDGRKGAKENARFIAAANPKAVIALLRELAAKDAELREYRKAEPVMYCMMVGESLDPESASTCKSVVDSWVEEWNETTYAETVPHKTLSLYATPHPDTAVDALPETVPDALRDEIIDLCAGYEIGDVGAQEIWSACRAAMLAEKS